MQIPLRYLKKQPFMWVILAKILQMHTHIYTTFKWVRGNTYIQIYPLVQPIHFMSILKPLCKSLFGKILAIYVFVQEICRSFFFCYMLENVFLYVDVLECFLSFGSFEVVIQYFNHPSNYLRSIKNLLHIIFVTTTRYTLVALNIKDSHNLQIRKYI